MKKILFRQKLRNGAHESATPSAIQRGGKPFQTKRRRLPSPHPRKCHDFGWKGALMRALSGFSIAPVFTARQKTDRHADEQDRHQNRV
jgi:hypothetical protein